MDDRRLENRMVIRIADIRDKFANQRLNVPRFRRDIFGNARFVVINGKQHARQHRATNARILRRLALDDQYLNAQQQVP